MQAALARHDALLRQAVEAHGGHVFETVGDQFCAAFAAAPEALATVLAAQQALQTEPWPLPSPPRGAPTRLRRVPGPRSGWRGQGGTSARGGPLRVRVDLHTGTAQERG
jgi:class 3 adenylate cyclase